MQYSTFFAAFATTALVGAQPLKALTEAGKAAPTAQALEKRNHCPHEDHVMGCTTPETTAEDVSSISSTMVVASPSASPSPTTTACRPWIGILNQSPGDDEEWTEPFIRTMCPGIGTKCIVDMPTVTVTATPAPTEASPAGDDYSAADDYPAGGYYSRGVYVTKGDSNEWPHKKREAGDVAAWPFSPEIAHFLPGRPQTTSRPPRTWIWMPYSYNPETFTTLTLTKREEAGAPARTVDALPTGADASSTQPEAVLFTFDARPTGTDASPTEPEATLLFTSEFNPGQESDEAVPELEPTPLTSESEPVQAYHSATAEPHPALSTLEYSPFAIAESDGAIEKRDTYEQLLTNCPTYGTRYLYREKDFCPYSLEQAHRYLKYHSGLGIKLRNLPCIPQGCEALLPAGTRVQTKGSVIITRDAVSGGDENEPFEGAQLSCYYGPHGERTMCASMMGCAPDILGQCEESEDQREE
ncbi:uncharacterized protein LTR77_009277 [Saxophila tyrrhenica]|uniref:Uncharacterized protein n=1 Tax=Saxophila tyrrhenica TaxID=1690608 RepID=A0AAV9NYM2_9PEZI|nr:hypothetical protein LTR77_009277 [Saxophila tyrrhenica]